MPDAIDDVFRAILAAPLPYDDLLHQTVLFAAACVSSARRCQRLWGVSSRGGFLTSMPPRIVRYAPKWPTSCASGAQRHTPHSWTA